MGANHTYLMGVVSAAAAKSPQPWPTLRPHRRQPTRLPVPGILQARTLEWVAISFSNAWKRKVKVKSLSRVRLLATPWTAAYQAPLSMDFPGKRTGVGCQRWHSPKTTLEHAYTWAITQNIIWDSNRILVSLLTFFSTGKWNYLSNADVNSKHIPIKRDAHQKMSSSKN